MKGENKRRGRWRRNSQRNENGETCKRKEEEEEEDEQGVVDVINVCQQKENRREENRLADWLF